MEWDNAIDGYVDHLRTLGRAPGTVDNHLTTITALRRWAPSVGRIDLASVDLPTVHRFVAETQDRRYRPATVLSRLGHLRQFGSWAYRAGYLPSDVGAEVVRRRRPRHEPRVLSESQLYALRDVIDAGAGKDAPVRVRDRLILGLFWAALLRTGEMCALDLIDVRPDTGVVLVHDPDLPWRRPIGLGTARATLRAYLSDARPALALPWTDNALLIGARGRRIHPGIVQRLIHEAAAAAGLPAWTTPRVVRDTMAVLLARDGMPVERLRELMRQSHWDLVAPLIRVAMVPHADVIAACHPRG